MVTRLENAAKWVNENIGPFESQEAEWYAGDEDDSAGPSARAAPREFGLADLLDKVYIKTSEDGNAELVVLGESER